MDHPGTVPSGPGRVAERLDTIVVPLIVADADAAFDFYCGVLALFEVSRDTMAPNGRRAVLLDRIGYRFSIALWLADSPEKVRVMGRQSGDRDAAFLILPVTDCEAVFKSLQSRGAHTEDDGILDLPWGRQLCVRDPFGTVICLMEWNPHLDRVNSPHGGGSDV